MGTSEKKKSFFDKLAWLQIPTEPQKVCKKSPGSHDPGVARLPSSARIRAKTLVRKGLSSKDCLLFTPRKYQKSKV